MHFSHKHTNPLFRIISCCQINTINPSPQVNTICPFHRYTQCIILSDRNNISSFQIQKQYSLLRSLHILFSDKHNTSTSQKFTLHTLLRNTLYPLLREILYILLTEMHIISSSRKTHYILFSEINIISSSQVNTLNPSRQIKRYTKCIRRQKQYIIFSDIKIIYTSQKYPYPLLR